MDEVRKPREANETYVKDYFKLYPRIDKRIKKAVIGTQSDHIMQHKKQ